MIETLLTVVLTILGTIFFLMLIASPFVILYVRYRKLNNITFIIRNIYKDNTTAILVERGRAVINERGRQFVTAKLLLPNSIKRTFGGLIRDEDIILSANSRGYICEVAVKDQIPSPLILRTKEHLNVESVNTENLPNSFSLTANMQESGEFYLDALRSNQKLNEKEKDFIQRLAAVAGVTVLLLCIIGVIVIIVLALTIAPQFIQEVTAPTVVELPPA